MANTIDTKRLVLRRFTLHDTDAVYAYASDNETVHYLTFDAHSSREESRFVVETLYMDNPYCYCIALKKNGVGIGAFDLRLDEKNNKASFGYVLNRSYWNKGLMTETLTAVIDMVFNTLHLNRIEATHYAGNEASGKVMQKCGMRYEGIGKEEVIIKSRYFDVIHYGLTAHDYRQFRVETGQVCNCT